MENTIMVIQITLNNIISGTENEGKSIEEILKLS